MKVIIGWAMLVLLGAIVAAPGGGCHSEQEKPQEKVRDVAFATGIAADAPLSSLSRAVVRAVEKYAPQYSITAYDNPGGTREVVENVDCYQLCGVSVDEAAQAYYGYWRWEGQLHPKLRLLCVIGQHQPISFVAARDSDITSIYHLDGRPMGCGEPGSMAELKATKLLEALGVAPDWNRDSWQTQLERYEEGELVGLVKEGAPAPSLVRIGEERSFRVLEISEEDLSRASTSHRETGLIYPPFCLEADTYPGQKELTTCALVLGYFTSADVSDDLAYELLKAAWSDVWNLSVAYEPLRLDIIGFPRLTLEYKPFPLHAGAVRFYQGLGLDVPGELIPPEMK